MEEYILHTNRGKFKIQAKDDTDALRLGLYYAWRDEESFLSLERNAKGEHYTIKIAIIDHNTNNSWTY